MTIRSYAIFISPVAEAPAMADILNDYDQKSLLVSMSATGQDPVTHRAGGDYVDAGWLAIFQNLASAPYVPTNGYPLAGGTTEAQALSAQAVFDVTVRTREDDGSLPGIVSTAVFLATGLQKIESL